MQKNNKEKRKYEINKTNTILYFYYNFKHFDPMFFFSLYFLNTILNKDYILNKMEECNYYEQTYLDMNEILEQYIGPSGLDEEVLKDIYTENKIKDDINTTVNTIFTGEEKQ